MSERVQEGFYGSIWREEKKGKSDVIISQSQENKMKAIVKILHWC